MSVCKTREHLHKLYHDGNVGTQSGGVTPLYETRRRTLFKYQTTKSQYNISLFRHNLPTSLLAFSHEVSFRNVKYCRSCTSCEMGKTCVQDFLELVNGIRKKCPDLLTECWWDGKPFPCCER